MNKIIIIHQKEPSESIGQDTPHFYEKIRPNHFEKDAYFERSRVIHTVFNYL